MAGAAARRHAYAKRRKYASGRVMWGAMYLVAEPDVYLSAGTFASKTEAGAAAHAKLDQIRRGLLTDPRKGRMPFADFAAHFLDDLMTRQKAKTQQGYRQVIASELIPAFGTTPLYELSPEHIAHWVTRLRHRQTRAGQLLAPSTIRSYKALLSGLLATAVEIGYIAYNRHSRSRPRKNLLGESRPGAARTSRR